MRDFTCKILESSELVKAQAMGNLLKEGEIVVGDFVEIQPGQVCDHYEIHNLLPRTNEIFRIQVRESKKKVTASNCDALIITTSVSRPNFKRGIIDRFLVRAIQWQIHPIVVFNKMDLFEGEVDLAFEENRLKEIGVQCFELSALEENYKPRFITKGAKELKKYISGKTVLFLGQSGVGKSQLITSLSDGYATLLSQEVGVKSQKGSHTTTWSEIIDCPDFFLIDSPGIRSLSLDDIAPNDLLSYFPDLCEIVPHCQFPNCKHEKDSKGCGFYQLDENQKSTQMILSRLDSYKRIYEEISELPQWIKGKKYK